MAPSGWSKAERSRKTALSEKGGSKRKRKRKEKKKKRSKAEGSCGRWSLSAAA